MRRMCWLFGRLIEAIAARYSFQIDGTQIQMIKLTSQEGGRDEADSPGTRDKSKVTYTSPVVKGGGGPTCWCLCCCCCESDELAKGTGRRRATARPTARCSRRLSTSGSLVPGGGSMSPESAIAQSRSPRHPLSDLCAQTHARTNTGAAPAMAVARQPLPTSREANRDAAARHGHKDVPQRHQIDLS